MGNNRGRYRLLILSPISFITRLICTPVLCFAINPSKLQKKSKNHKVEVYWGSTQQKLSLIGVKLDHVLMKH